MALTVKPLIIQLSETKDAFGNQNFIKDMEANIRAQAGTDADLFLDYPVIYIHLWQNADDIRNGKYSVYVGESENVLKRTATHYRNAKIPAAMRTKDSDWQFHMLEDKDDKGKLVVPTMYIIAHKYFNKSLTLALENKLIDYCDAMVETARTYNGRPNPQGEYYSKEFFDDIFSMIWRQLRSMNKNLFLPESKIKKSAIFKSSPNHKLTDDQEKAKITINDRVFDAVINNKVGQLIFVEGEAGTGKTVLTSSTFYEMIESDVIKNRKLDCKLLINHDEQYTNYQTMAKQLGLDSDVVQQPTEFINNYSIIKKSGKKIDSVTPSKIADVVFIDEGHLLWTQPKQAFSLKHGTNQLDEILKRARVVVMMFDEYQILRKEQFIESSVINAMRNFAKSQGPDPHNADPNLVQNNYIPLVNQLRMKCSKDVMDWIDGITKGLTVNKLSLTLGKDSEGYEVKVFDTPKELHDAILKKANKEETELSRVLATYDWPFILDKAAPAPKTYWDVSIGTWSLPWNEQHYHIDVEPTLGKRQKQKLVLLDWAEKDYSKDEVGSTFTIQGFDLDYSGVIIGPSVKYNKATNKIYFDESKRGWDKMTGTRTLPSGAKVKVADTLSQHELRVLLTRGTQGLYLYICDDDLRDAIKDSLK